MSSPFLQIPVSLWVASNELAFAVRDRAPVSPGHTLVIPRRVVASWFDATTEERAALFELVDVVKRALDAGHPRPDAYNLGINDGPAAGQTVPHLHVHVIPRFAGDVRDPRGGVRYVIPARGHVEASGGAPRAHEGPSRHLVTGGPVDPFVAHLRPVLRTARRVDVVAAFVQGSGVDLLSADIAQALDRGTRFRILTGDYLHITQAHALRRLLDWSRVAASSEAERAAFEVRIVETTALGGRAFHPKAWRVEGEDLAVAWVGSSNWSRSALTHGVEWNLRLERDRQPSAWLELDRSVDLLWASARPLDLRWLAAYAARAASVGLPLPPELAPHADAPERPAPLPGPQSEALAALANARAEGRRRALVVLATGLGKTFLAAFDLRAFGETLGRPPRLLFLAHRRELLLQASRTYRRVFPDADLGLFVGRAAQLDATLVFASVQKLARPEHLEQLTPSAFDYVVVDEGHHAPADTYRRVLERLRPAFLLGLTATPERADDADVADLFDGHVAHRADLAVGIERRALVPFHYLGLKDTITYRPVPWRQVTPDELEGLAVSQARMEKLWEAWQTHPGTRTLVFCVSIRHADFVADWLTRRGVRAAAVHTGPGSADRDAVLDGLDDGTLDAAVAVDLFNEGIDVPRIDRVVMLRPTDSPVVFLQQLGRGLRTADGKSHLQVIDFVGNHTVFLERVRTLLSLSSDRTSLRDFLAAPEAARLPPGCTVDLELEAIDLLSRLLPKGSADATVRTYRDLRDLRGERPTPGELVRRGLNPASVRRDHGHWFGFVGDEGDLTPEERLAVDHGEAWLRAIERASISPCFGLVTLQVVLAADQLFGAMPVDALARASHAYLLRHRELLVDLEDVGARPDPTDPDPPAWQPLWRERALGVWTRGSRPWFRVEDEALRFQLPPPAEAGVRDALERLTRHLVDGQLARRRRGAHPLGPSSFRCTVAWREDGPRLVLPTGRDPLPRGDVDVRLADGQVWTFRFGASTCEVARPLGSSRNQLADLLRTWFGPGAGVRGVHEVGFHRSPEGWWVEPRGQVPTWRPREHVVAYPTLHAAASATGESAAHVDADSVRLPVDGGDHRFAVRVAGDSMDGGARPLRDGDWAVLEWSRSLGAGALVGRVVLVARGDPDAGPTHHLKRLVRGEGQRLVLRSDNPAAGDLDGHDTTVIARLVDVVRPEDLGPPEGAILDDVAEAFALSASPQGAWSRVDGHLFVIADRLDAPDELRLPVPDRRPSETAFVLLRRGQAHQYVGVGRWTDGAWRVPAVDFPTWRALGAGRSASRRLDDAHLEAARALVADLLRAHPPGAWVEARGRRCRVVGASPGGGVRIDGGPDGMRARTVSLVDLAWVLAARQDVARRGGLLDEQRVNRLRYLDGTPRASTRWIDTGWALVLAESILGRTA